MVISAPGFSADAACRSARLAVDVDGAGAAQRHAAAVLGAGQIEVVAQHPQERRVAGAARRDVDALLVDEKMAIGAPEGTAANAAKQQ